MEAYSKGASITINSLVKTGKIILGACHCPAEDTIPSQKQKRLKKKEYIDSQITQFSQFNFKTQKKDTR